MGYWISTGYPEIWGRRPQKFSGIRQRRKFWVSDPETLQVSRQRRETPDRRSGTQQGPAFGGIIRPSAEILGYWISTGYPKFGDASPKVLESPPKAEKSGPTAQNSTSLPTKSGNLGLRPRTLQVSRQWRESLDRRSRTLQVSRLWRDNSAHGRNLGLLDIHWISIFGDVVPKSSRVSAKGGKSGPSAQNSTSLPPLAGKSGPTAQNSTSLPPLAG